MPTAETSLSHETANRLGHRRHAKTHFTEPVAPDGTEQEYRTSWKTLAINGPSLVQVIPMGGINNGQMGCSCYTCLLTANPASLYTAKPKHGRLIRILLCRCRYEHDVNRDTPENMCCSSLWRQPAASHMVQTVILTSKTTRHVGGCTLLPLRIGRTDPRSSRTSILCLEIPVTLGHVTIEG